MAAIARAAGISKALLYHYFPSKQAFILATLEATAGELAERVRADPDLPPAEQLVRSPDAFLAWVEGNPDAYRNLMADAPRVPELAALVDRVRAAAARERLRGLLLGTLLGAVAALGDAAAEREAVAG
jgi:AcrR family transcriptional regulator